MELVRNESNRLRYDVMGLSIKELSIMQTALQCKINQENEFLVNKEDALTKYDDNKFLKEFYETKEDLIKAIDDKKEYIKELEDLLNSLQIK